MEASPEAAYMAAPEPSQNDRLLLHRGLRPYMALGVVLTVIALAQIALHA